MEVTNEKPIEIFFSYARKDESLMSELEKHLYIMQRQGLITRWHDNKISPGEEWEQETTIHLNNADIILLLISADFMISEYCYSAQMGRAMERHEKGEAIVIPVILRAVAWEDAPFYKLKALPKNAKPVTLWRDRDKAFLSVSKGIRSAIKTLSKTSPTASNTPTSKIAKRVFYCDNCKAPVSLPMPCWKCGLYPIQICNECLAKNPVDRETCQKCDAPLSLACNHCKTKNSFEADFCRNCGLPLQLICDECGAKNLPDRETCQKCGVPLIQLCSHCNQKNSLEAELCCGCGMPFTQICITCGAFNEMEDGTCWRCNTLLNVEYSLDTAICLVQDVF
jgi:ribosomal protein L40E